MDAYYILALIWLFSLSGVQGYTVNKKFSTEGKVEKLQNDREIEEHHQHHYKHGHPHDPMVCCDSKTEISQEEAESHRKAIIKCKDYMIEGTGPKDRNMSVCLMNCVMEALNLMEDNGRIKNRALEIIMEHHNDVIDDKARTKMKEMCYDKKAGPLDDTWHTECNKEAYNLVACAHHVKEMLCPGDKQIEGRRCDEYREEMKKMYSN